MIRIRYAALLLIAITACDKALSPAEIQARLQSESVKLNTWTTDAALVSAVNAQNAQHLALSEIQHRDSLWIAGNAAALVTATTTGACADRLRQLASQSAIYGE